MIDLDKLQAELMRTFQDELFLEVDSPNTDLFQEGILDSLTFVELLVKIEAAYSVTVALEDLDTEKFRTIELIAQFVQQEAAA